MSPTGFEPDEGVRSWQALVGKLADSEATVAESPDPSRSSAEPTVTLSHEEVLSALDAARTAWLKFGDTTALRQSLLDLLRRIEDRE